MSEPSVVRGVVIALILWLVGHLQAETPSEKFYQAYYLQHSRGDCAAAAPLYGDALKTAGADAALRAEADTGLAECREELATADFARLMPTNAIAYVEINRPGERIGKLLDQLGLLAKRGEPPTAGDRLAISPELVNAVLGMRGAALALTGIDPAAQRPSGVVVFHPGDMDFVRGLIETALPVNSKPAPAIGGYPTYEVEGAFVTLTARLVIVGSNPGEIAGVLERMRNPDEESLASNPELAEVLKERDGALLFFCVNPKPLMPLLNGLMAMGATQCREAALVHALADPRSFRSLTGRFDLSDEGLLLELTLRLEKGHRNLIYNFFRRPGLDPATLQRIPAGAAAFAALAMNQAPPQYAGPATAEEPGTPVVTALDIARELFANINGIAVFGLPPDGTVGGPADSPLIPNIGAVITVNDPAKSAALWRELLGIASLAAGGASIDGQPREVAGVQVQSYRFADAGFSLQLAIQEHELLIATTDAVISRVLQTRAGQGAITQDPVFAGVLNRIDPHTTLALAANPARCVQMAEPYIPPEDLLQARRVTDTMTETVAAVLVTHSDQMLRLSARVTGVPNVSGLVSELIREQRDAAQARGHEQEALQLRHRHGHVRVHLQAEPEQ